MLVQELVASAIITLPSSLMILMCLRSASGSTGPPARARALTRVELALTEYWPGSLTNPMTLIFSTLRDEGTMRTSPSSNTSLSFNNLSLMASRSSNNTFRSTGITSFRLFMILALARSAVSLKPPAAARASTTLTDLGNCFCPGSSTSPKI